MQVHSTDIRCFVYAAGVQTQVRVGSDAVVGDVLDAIETQDKIPGFKAATWRAYPMEFVGEAYKKKSTTPCDIGDIVSVSKFGEPRRVWVEPATPAVATSPTVPGTSRQMHMKCRGDVGTWVMVMGVDLWE